MKPIFYLCFIVVLLYIYFGVNCEFQLDSFHLSEKPPLPHIAGESNPSF